MCSPSVRRTRLDSAVSSIASAEVVSGVLDAQALSVVRAQVVEVLLHRLGSS